MRRSLAVFNASLIVIGALSSGLVKAAPCPSYAQGKQALVDKSFMRAAALFERCTVRPVEAKERFKGLLGVALARELGGDFVMAARAYLRFLNETAAPALAKTFAAKRQQVTSIVARLKPQLSAKGWLTLTLRSHPTGAAIWVGKRRHVGRDTASVTPATILAPKGQVELQLRAPGHEVWSKSFNLTAPQTLTATLKVHKPSVVKLPSVPVQVPNTRVVEIRELDERFWVPVIIGSASIIAGLALVGVAVSEVDIYHGAISGPGTNLTVARESRETLANLERSYWSLFGVGAAAIAGGIIAHFMSEPMRYEVLAAPEPDGAKVSIQGRF